MFDADLVRIVNTGRCFALVGAGASAEMGYPSWHTLAVRVRDHVLAENLTADAETYKQFLAKRNLPAVFRQAEVDLGSRDSIVALVKRILESSPRTGRRAVYDLLARWPFACYLTTNYDDELRAALEKIHLHFQVLHNSVEDLSNLRDGATRLIVKLHSDLDHPSQVVLTSADYNRIVTSDDGKWFRDKLCQVFQMFDVLIIGHSMSDLDMQLILATAKHSASALHPIYMIVANATTGESREYQEHYNIRVLSYEDRDGSHSQLRRMLAVTDRFISPRHASIQTAPAVDEEEIQAAASLFIHRRLRAMVFTEPVDEMFGPLVLGIISSAPKPMAASEIASHSAIATLAASHDLKPAITQSLGHLATNGYLTKKGETFTVTATGREISANASRQRQLEEDQALGQFEVDFKRRYSPATPADSTAARKALRDALVTSFRSRGLAMANVIVAGQSLRSDELHDIFRAISQHAACFTDFERKAAFIEAAHTFLVHPNEPQKRYLAAVSQGYFLYHLAGLDPTCAKVRRDLFARTCWFLDSSVLIPLLAIGSHNHAYATDLFAKLHGVRALLFTTERLFQETWRHLTWALDRVRDFGVDSPEFMAAGMSRVGYKQNLFVDGYVRLAADGAVGTFAEYIEKVIGTDVSHEQFFRKCEEAGVNVLRIDELDGFSQIDWGDIEDLKASLTQERESRGTYRGPFQVAAEAEVLVLIRKLRGGAYKLPDPVASFERVYFVSQSRALDFVSSGDDVVTWTPEAVYRYVSSLPGTAVDPELLQECMLHEYFYAGISFVDRARYVKFFGRSISQAKLVFQEQRDKYLAETPHTYRADQVDEAFERIPDLEKPFFVAQMGWELARAAEEKARKAGERTQSVQTSAELRVREAQSQAAAALIRAQAAEANAETDRKARARAETDANRLRNLQDPKHQRKRDRQAKKRKRKKRK